MIVPALNEGVRGDNQVVQMAVKDQVVKDEMIISLLQDPVCFPGYIVVHASVSSPGRVGFIGIVISQTLFYRVMYPIFPGDGLVLLLNAYLDQGSVILQKAGL